MLARTALARLRAKVPSAAARDVPHLSRQLRTTFARASSNDNLVAVAPLTALQFHCIRGYATATKTRVATAKKTTAKKGTTTKKAAPKKKADPKKTKTKKATAKKGASSKPKSTVSPEVLEKRRLRAQEQKKKDAIKALRATALQEPKLKPAKIFQIVLTELVKNEELKRDIAVLAKAASEKYRNLNPSELEHYNRLANEASEENKKTYKKWVESYTPNEIRLANNARRQLSEKLPHYRKGSIQDERLVKQPTSAYIIFSKERFGSGDFKNMSVTEAAKLIGQEWKALSSSSKQKYLDLAENDKKRYVHEYKETYGEEPQFVGRTAAASSA